MELGRKCDGLAVPESAHRSTDPGERRAWVLQQPMAAAGRKSLQGFCI